MSTRQNLGRPREAILEAATHLFSQTGFAGTTMRDIAKAVGVLPGSLYAHIDGKETLLFEIVELGIGRFLAIGDPLMESTEPAEIRLRQAIKAHVNVVAESPERTLVVFHQWRYLTGANLEAAIEKRRRYENAFTTIMQDGVDSGAFSPDLHVKIAVLTVLGALNWTPEWYRPDGAIDADRIGDMLADTLLMGLHQSAP